MRRFLPYLLLVCAVLLTFGSALRAPFHFDDRALFADSAITSPGGWISVWRPEQSRPLTYFTFWINHSLGGQNPAGYHAVNLALHALCACLLLVCLSALIPRQSALIAAFLFAVHPIQTEAVMYVFARSTLLTTAFCLAALFAWTRQRRWIAVILFAFALLAKEEAAAFPLVLLLLHLAGRRETRDRAPIACMLALAAAAAGRVAILAAVIPGSGAGAHAGISPLDYFFTQGYVILRYLRLLAIPAGFSVDPALTPMPDWRGVIAWIALAGLAWIAWRDLGRSLSSLWFLAGLVLLIPTSSIFPAADLAADRRMYLPLLGFAPVAGLLLERTRYPVLLPALIVACALFGYARAQVWRSEAALWEDAVRSAPGRIRPRIQLARALPPRQALEQLFEARNVAPDDPAVASELGRVFLEMGNPSQALAEFGRAVAANPNDALALNNRGVALVALGLRDHALHDFRKALEIDPCLFDARMNLAKTGEKTPLPADCRFSNRQVRDYNSR
ncbi:MAG: glycosyltransferase family 39 protein [Bryobacteraceae bacterium]